MSSFCGVMREFPGVSVDQFEGMNRESTIFFLSHCHLDHMKGLDILEPLPGPLYVSEMSAVILRKRFPHLTDIRVLEIGVETSVKVSGEEVHVTAIPAGHCPGSVMMLFESLRTRVLYTGDFRFSKEEIQKSAILHRLRENLDTIYLDSTFLMKDYAVFPSRKESTNEVIRYIKDWVQQSTNHLIYMDTPAKYGQEYLFLEIFKHTKLPIHVDVSSLANYVHVPDMDGVFTTDGGKCQIHACWDNCMCLKDQTKKIRTIRPTAMAWRNFNLSHGISYFHAKDNTAKVCYSSHSSYEEIREFLLFLKPHRVELNVISPNRATDRAEKFKLLREILSEYKSTKTTESSSGKKVAEGRINGEEMLIETFSFKKIKYEKEEVNDVPNEFSEKLKIPKRKKAKAITDHWNCSSEKESS